MKMDKIAGSGNDEFYTPAYAIRPILKYVPTSATVWCPFDTEESLFVRMLQEHGCKVIYSHLTTGHDFFTCDPPTCDCIVSNPPYSTKGAALKRLFALGKPFAMLVGVVGLFESRERFEMFESNAFEVMYLDKRVAYMKDYKEGTPSLHPPFSSVYVCHRMLPRPIVFERIEK